MLKTNKEIFILRSEYFWKDWQNINTLLGGGKVYKVDSITHYECTRPKITNRTISDDGMRNLCYFLCSDIQLYKKLLRKSVNLNEQETRMSWMELNFSCPVEMNRNDCRY